MPINWNRFSRLSVKRKNIVKSPPLFQVKVGEFFFFLGERGIFIEKFTFYILFFSALQSYFFMTLGNCFQKLLKMSIFAKIANR